MPTATGRHAVRPISKRSSLTWFDNLIRMWWSSTSPVRQVMERRLFSRSAAEPASRSWSYANDPLMREYCLAGAAEAMPAPVDIMLLNQTVQQIIQLSKNSRDLVVSEPGQMQPVLFSGLTLHPHENRLTGADGSTVKLTTSENRVLIHFVSNPWILCTRDALAEALYGSRRPTTDRAVDVIVTRLRKKIATLGGPAAQRLIKTEFRRGYVFVAEVSLGAPPAAGREAPPLHARTA